VLKKENKIDILHPSYKRKRSK